MNSNHKDKTDDDNDVRKIYLTIIGKGYSYRIKA